MKVPEDWLAGERALLIAGPTASGKSALALAAAEAALSRGRPAVVINADSMQVYDALRLVTARPSVEEEARAPHRLYGHVPAAERYSVGRWLADIGPVLAACRAEGALAVVVGGTGLYFKALTEGLTQLPDIAPEVRRHWAAELAARGPQTLHRLLAERDPHAAAAIRPADRQRIARALEVLDATGRPLSEWREAGAAAALLPAASARLLVVAPERPALLARIDARFDAMLQQGAVDEVRALLAQGLDAELPVMKATGLRELAGAVRGEVSLEAAAAAAKTATRRYAKRQATWLRHQMSDWPRLDPDA